jgi:hypothetical protein
MDNFYQSCPARMNDSRFITDYRNPTVRERENKKLFGTDLTEDMYRISLQKYGSKLYPDMSKTCATNSCIHKGRTRVVNTELYDELQRYNAVRTGKLTLAQAEFPKCSLFNQYQLN